MVVWNKVRCKNEIFKFNKATPRVAMLLLDGCLILEQTLNRQINSIYLPGSIIQIETLTVSPVDVKQEVLAR